jgi:prepilin-type N-terminal cleavage/methylation domain-containing protein
MQLRNRARGTTLVELMAVLAVLGIAALAVSFQFSARPTRSSSQWEVIDQARRSALATGLDSTFVVADSGRVFVVTVYSDGAVKRQLSRAK